MGFKILNKLLLANQVKRLDIEAPNIAKKAQPGQFVGVCPDEGDERVPLTIIEADPSRGFISIIFYEAGETTKKLGAKTLSESIFSVLGPLGVPANIKKQGVVTCVATGIGAAQILPIARAYKKAGNKVIGIIGAKTKQSLMVEAQMRLVCNKIFVTTNDGTYERKGLATDMLQNLIDKEDVNLVYAIGSIDMMRAVCDMTRKKKIRTRVQLNPVMVDCMGMCGSCRVKVGGKIILACTDGPEFDGHKVDFDDFEIRMNAFEGKDEWNNQAFQRNPQRSGSGILPKFLSDILKG